MFKRMSEWHLDEGSVNPKNGRIIRRGQSPVIPYRSRLEILDTDASGIDPYGLREGFGEGFEESFQFLGLIFEEILPEVFHEAIIDFGFVFFHYFIF